MTDKILHTAPGQFLGYILQIPRAVFYLLKSGPGGTVSVEVLGDVASIDSEMQVISEEDKSSVSSNPVTNRSTDLWKSFHNWILAIENGQLDLNKTIFILYTNQKGRLAIVDDFHNARNLEEAEAALSQAELTLSDVDESHDIWPFYRYVLGHRDIMKSIITNFEFIIGEGTAYEEIHEELIRQHIPQTQIIFFTESISGWLTRLLSEKIKNSELAVVSWEEFDSQFNILFQRVRTRELIDFTLNKPINPDHIDAHLTERPCYIKQLDNIECDDDEILEAVSNFLRAKVNRDKWIEGGIIDESVAKEFQEKLVDFWSNRKRAINITHKSESEKNRGRLLLYDCMARQVNINNLTPPSSTISGTYHELANQPSIGWHPNWKKLFKSES